MLRAKIDREAKYGDKVWDELELLKAGSQPPPRVTLLQDAARCRSRT